VGAQNLEHRVNETAVCFDCQGVPLVGIIHRPTNPKRRGVLMVVAGGPQYRVGGHRQRVIWARRLAAEGYPTFRFDYRGAGDSYGDYVGFEGIDDDIRSALDHFSAEVPELDEIVLWGECNSVSSVLFYAFRDPRVKGLVMLNPWVRTESGQARALLRHYYLDRLLQPSFWLKLLSLRFNPWTSLRSAVELMHRVRKNGSAVAAPSGDNLAAALSRDGTLPDRMLAGFSRFGGPMIIMVSGRDLIAREFDDLLLTSQAWQEEVRTKAPIRHTLPDADHSFSSAEQRDQVIALGLEWLRTW
jgi:exosortase A-associated hydrolase 1